MVNVPLPGPENAPEKERHALKPPENLQSPPLGDMPLGKRQPSAAPARRATAEPLSAVKG